MYVYTLSLCFFFQAEDGIRDLVRSRGLGDVYKRQGDVRGGFSGFDATTRLTRPTQIATGFVAIAQQDSCLLYTSDAADERSSVDLGGRRIIKKKKNNEAKQYRTVHTRDKRSLRATIISMNEKK